MAEVEKEVEASESASTSKDSLRGVGFGSAQTGRKKGGRKGAKSSTVRRPAPERPIVEPSRKDASQEQVYEQYYVVSLAIVFGLIILEGLALAASGFLPEDLDDLVLKYLYPSFSPTIGFFLLGSSLYGLYKYLGGQKTNS